MRSYNLKVIFSSLISSTLTFTKISEPEIITPSLCALSPYEIKGKTLWALDRMSQEIYQFDLSGNEKNRFKLQYKLDTPVSLEVSPQQKFFVLDRALAKVFRFNHQGKYLDSFGQHGYRRGQFNYPAQLIFDWKQRLCIVNQGNDRIEVFTPGSR